MKIKYLLDLSVDASDLLDFFENVVTPEQLVSRLERLKRNAPEELLACVEGLRASLETFLQDTVEPSGALDDEPDDEASKLGTDLRDLMSELDKPDDTTLAENTPASPAPASPAPPAEKDAPPPANLNTDLPLLEET